MEIRVRDTGAVMLESEFRAMHPNTSFPVQLSDELLNDFGADVVFEGPQASPTRYQVAYRDGVEQVNGKWYTKYSVADMGADGIAAVDAQLKAANEARAKQELETSDWAELPTVRDPSKTPHLVNAAAFDAYRVELRAIVVNPPVDVAQWPARPDAVWSS